MRKIILSFAACLALAAYGQKPVQDTRAMDTFIDQLMGKMTLDEKIGQLNLSGGGVPGILSGSEGADETIRWGWLGATGGSELETFRKLQEIAVKESRLGIPLLFGLDVIHGYHTIFPIPLALSCSWDTTLIEQSARIAAIVVTDYTGINEMVAHSIVRNDKEAGELAANAGIDMDMTGGIYSQYLVQSVKEGKVSEENIDRAVASILEMKFLLGLFDDPYRYLDNEREKNTIMKPEFLQEARETSARSIVLLKNDNNFFPISKDKHVTVALIGPMVKDKINQNGEWAGRGEREESISLFEGLTEKYAGTNVKFIYAEGCDLLTDDSSKFAEAIATARRADIVLAAMGEDFNWSGEAACRTDLKLPGAQQALLKELKKTGKPLGLILVNGRPLDLSWEDQHVDGILEAWYLGTMAGHGMADVISGDYNPSARLTMSFPRTVGQLPLYYNQKPTGRPVPPEAPDTDYKSRYMDVPNTPLYPFGYGLSYTTFAVNSMKLDQNSFTKGGKITVTAEVENTGKVDGETVVQMYIRDLAGSVTRPVKELKGFEKVALKAGEKKQVSFTIDEALLAFYGIDMQKKAEPGDFTVWIGLNSADETNQSSFSLR